MNTQESQNQSQNDLPYPSALWSSAITTELEEEGKSGPGIASENISNVCSYTPFGSGTASRVGSVDSVRLDYIYSRDYIDSGCEFSSLLSELLPCQSAVSSVSFFSPLLIFLTWLYGGAVYSGQRRAWWGTD
jgi:hypothetical protein